MSKTANIELAPRKKVELDQKTLQDLRKHSEMQTQLKKLKDDEMNLRRNLVAALGDKFIFSGSEYLEIEEIGLVLKITKSMKKDIDFEIFDNLVDLSETELSIVKTKTVRSLDTKALQYLPEDSEVFEAITAKPEAPSLSYDWS